MDQHFFYTRAISQPACPARPCPNPASSSLMCTVHTESEETACVQHEAQCMCEQAGEERRSVRVCVYTPSEGGDCKGESR